MFSLFTERTSAQFTMKLVFSEKVTYFENKMVVVQKPVLDRYGGILCALLFSLFY